MSEETKPREREVFLYNLTPMTGKDAQKERRTVHFTIEMTRNTRNAQLIAIPVTLIVLGISIVIIRVLPLIPVWLAAIPVMATYAGVLAFTLMRQRRGMQLRQWRAFVDKKRARTGVFIQCGSVIDPLSSAPLEIVRSGVPNDVPQEWDADLILDEVNA